MSHLPEATYALYVDEELPPDEVRAVELHLVQCRACRALVLALREESDLLSDALHDRLAEPARPAAAAPAPAPAALPAPARGLALGLAPALALLVAASGVVGWLLESGLPAGIDWLNPVSLRGAFRMTFDLVFLVRDRAPELFEVGVAVAAMASVSAILTFALNAVVRRGARGGALLLAGAALLGAPGSSEAHFGLHEHEDLVIAAGETHEGTLVTWAHDVSIDGAIDGDLVVFAKRLVVRGEVRGNVFAVGETVELRGRVRGSVHAGADLVSVSGEVDGNVYAAGERVSFAESGRVARDATLAGESVLVEGAVGRDLHLFSERSELRGSVARNVVARSERLELRDAARVGGDVDAVLPRGTEVERSAGARVGGEVRVEPRARHHEDRLDRYTSPKFYVWLALHVAAFFVLGLLLYALAPRLFGQPLETAGAFFRSLGIGLLSLVAAPLAVAFAAVTIVGIPVALIGLGVFLASLLASAVLVADLIGRALVRPTDEAWTRFGWSLLAGLVVLVVATHLPFVGGPLRLIAILTGLGLLVERARQVWLASRTPVP